ncbi:MAG: TIM barrel protein [Planctomycetes bacterium]|nr:TIM barrel protein [Planctomycetota bacterium]
MTRFRLIGNNGFTTEDYPEPEAWAGVLARAGLTEFEYFADHLEPVLFRRVVRERSEFFEATRQAVAGAGLKVWSGATARVSYLLNLLNHPYADMRREGLEWCKAFIDLARALGAPYISGHYDIMSKRDLAGDFAGAMQRIVDGLVAMSEYAAEKGLSAIFLEQMHRPQLQPNTLARGRELLAAINARSAVPVRMHLDMGHAAPVFDDPTHGPRDKDPYAWLAEPWGDNRLVLVHTQQSDAAASRHWPFTPEFNAKGLIDGRRAIEALASSGVGEAVLALEILFARGTPIEDIEPAITASAAYWHEALEGLGYTRAADGAYEKA